ncbi:MAG: transketolase-like TK C-terminal-containing protein, partial [Advenella sp.]
LGAGRALAIVTAAAQLLREDWDVMSEIWSCPSYTRLARDGYATEYWNMLHPSDARKPHIGGCLGSNGAPVIAVTGYTKHIADQIGAFIPARFVSLGSDSYEMQSHASRAQWTVVTALKALAAQRIIPDRCIADALKRYALT